MLIILGFISIKINLLSKNKIFVYLFIMTGLLILQATNELIISRSWSILTLNIIVVSIFASITYLLTTLYIMKLFPVELRYSGVAITYNIGFAIAEATTPIAFTWVIHKTHTQFALIYCFLFIFSIGIITTIVITQYKNQNKYF